MRPSTKRNKTRSSLSLVSTHCSLITTVISTNTKRPTPQSIGAISCPIRQFGAKTCAPNRYARRKGALNQGDFMIFDS